MAIQLTGNSAEFPVLYRGANFKLFHQSRRTWRKVFVQYQETTASLKLVEKLTCNCLEIPTLTFHNVIDLQEIHDHCDVNGHAIADSLKSNQFALHFDKNHVLVMKTNNVNLRNTWLQEIRKMQQQREYMIDGTGEVYLTFLKYSSDGVDLSREDFLKFLCDNQKMTCSFEEMDDMLRRSFNHHSATIGYRIFKEFLLSVNADIINPKHRTLYQDMNLPLTDYFISTSHNTYLLEDQLFGPSDCVAYKNALLSGCRCVELDIWNGPDNEPIIYHGHTLTSKILFKDVCNTIKDNAFVNSPYPVILSLENHCSVEQQKVMADHMKTVFGDALYQDGEADFFEQLPSPTDLKGKIIVKGKKFFAMAYSDAEDDGNVSEEDEAKEIPGQLIDCLKNTYENTNLDSIRLFLQNAKKSSFVQVKYNTSSSAVEIEVAEKESEKKTEKKTEKNSSIQENMVDQAESDFTEIAFDQDNNFDDTLGVDEHGRQMKLHADLSDLVTICRSVKFRSFENSRDTSHVTEMISLSENDFSELTLKSSNAFVKHTQFQLVRTYPAGFRVDSSNYYPNKAWISGCQLVALNFQTPTTPMHLNQSLFSLNGGCGYVLKPDLLRRPETKFFPANTMKSKNDLHLSIQIVSGYKLYKSTATTERENIFPRYIKVHVFGVAKDEYEAKSGLIQDNGFNPSWKQTFQTDVTVPDLAFLRLCVKEDTTKQGHFRNLKRQFQRKIACQGDDKLIGHFTCPLTSIQPGYRFVPLMDMYGNLVKDARLFVHINFNE